MRQTLPGYSVFLVKAISFPFLCEPKRHVQRSLSCQLSIQENVQLSSLPADHNASSSNEGSLGRHQAVDTDEIDAGGVRMGKLMSDHCNRMAESIDLAEFARCKEESV